VNALRRLAEPQAPGIEVTDSGIPRVRSTLRLNWTLADWSAMYAFRYVCALTEDCGAARGFAVCRSPTPTARRASPA
jgi:iron complex outermembrane receptor protein